jgi:hypothetical protein
MDPDFATGCNTSYRNDIPIDLIRLIESNLYSQLILDMLPLFGKRSINTVSSSCFYRNMFG